MKTGFRHTKLFLFIAIALLSSCLKMTTEIQLNSDGTVDTELVYTLEKPEFGQAWAAEKPASIPLSKEYFVQRALLESGTEVIHYKETESAESRKISVKLKSSSVQSLASYLAIPLEQQGNNKQGKLILGLHTSNRTTEQKANWRNPSLEKLLKNSIFTIRILNHSTIREVNAGTNTKKIAELKLSLFDILLGDTVEEWIVSWF